MFGENQKMQASILKTDNIVRLWEGVRNSLMEKVSIAFEQ